MTLVLLGVNHTTASVELRERLAVPEDRLPELLASLNGLPEVEEVCALSTCNRVEVILAVGAAAGADCAVRRLLEWRGVEPDLVAPSLYRLEEAAVARHLFRVASGLDSLVLGEPQILGQVKEAYAAALRARTAGPRLSRLFHTVFRVAKRIRTETGLGVQGVSVGHAAVALARRIFDDLTTKRVLVLGAGEMAEITARHLVASGVRDVTVASRSAERARALAMALGGRTAPYEALAQAVGEADIVVASTGSPTPIVHAGMVADLMRARRQKPLFFIDIAVPRNVDPRVHDLTNVYLYDIDDLKAVVEEGRSHRQREAGRAERIVEEEVEAFVRGVRTREVVPTIVALRRRFEAIRRAELARMAAALRDLTPEQRKAVERLTEGMLGKLLHAPTATLKRLAEEAEGSLYADALATLFELDRATDAPRGREAASERSAEATPIAARRGQTA
ncbi:MAG TPA: glutamyl-tRNA reductase [Thermodesulfobacteriota bacterium]